ncbi:MAG: S-layer homology domain-containing protein [Cohnella sp.]|nr:S-layer homology domain-containing protein [Cohnella sp.]
MAMRFRKLSAMLLACALLVPASLASAKTSEDFSDLKDLDAATKAKFDALINAGVFEGVGNDKFGLGEEMNRAQFAKVAALIFGLKVDESLRTSSFSDVAADDRANGYALPFIEAVKAAGITDGVGNGKFDPGGTVTKEQLATFIVRGLGLDKEAQSLSPSGTDESVSDWAKGYVQLALNLNILDYSADGKFGGTTSATRDLLVTSSYTAAQKAEAPLSVGEAKLDGNKELTIVFTSPVDPNSIKLSNIKINGIALDDQDSFELSEDGKTLIIKLHVGFSAGSSANPTIDVKGVTTKMGNSITASETPVPLAVTNPPPAPIIVPPVYAPPPPPPPPALSVTSVTYSVYEPAIPTVGITVHYSPSGPATAYYVATWAPADISGYAPQDIKAMRQGNYSGTYISMVFCGDGVLDSSGSAFYPVEDFHMPTYVYLVVEKDGQFSSIHELFVDAE